MQLNTLKWAMKNESEVVLRLSSNMIDDDETNFPHKLLLTNRQVANLRKAFAYYLAQINFRAEKICRNRRKMTKIAKFIFFLAKPN